MSIELTLSDAKGKVSLDEAVFGTDFNEALVHQVVTAYRNGGRQGSKANKSRAQVSGGNSKPWRQKKTGRARVGSSRNPLWRSGGVTFARSPRNFSQKMNRKAYRAGMRSILSELIRQERFKVVGKLELKAPKTKDYIAMADKLGVSGRVLYVVPQEEGYENVWLSARNVIGADMATVNNVDPVRLVAADHVVFTNDALEQLQERLK